MGSLRNLKTQSHLDRVKEGYVEIQRKLAPILDRACEKDDPALVRAAIEMGADVNFVDRDDPLTRFNACYEHGQHKVLHTLITYGNLDLNLQDRMEGDTPLHRAAAMADYGVVLRLIKMGADLTIKNKRGLTPLGEVRWNLGMTFEDNEFDRRTKREYLICERLLMKYESRI